MSDATVTASHAGIPYQVSLSDGLHQWLADEPAELGGGNQGPGPFQLLLSSLGACTAITLAMYARRKQWPLDGIQVQLRLSQEKPGNSRIARDIGLNGALDDAQRQRLLEIANACPVHKLLSGEIHIDSQLV
ncbi:MULTISPECIES: OsmC family protein [Pseudomonas]|jgi:putative redox protein|uniref:OsmC family protein n=1 Tax=Pseudomonas citronellolis TaxID=53408 RepID=A0AAW6P862_9PSED|nr:MULTISPECIES: OsmC family protein [Pseudomonas]AMO76380.1 OsmC-like protein [Pseudomonas citronellolis]KES21280.1 peroxiredoxin [Pseudomonas sp. AAC]MDF3843673.1 OsmC family protein [Pseudomonas citronellolis]OHR95519.1 peroxiredoxin [Pseudomonas sp. HMSC75E02]WBG62016.1 OsmC family peroxiredoxin [Pseudomonas citronellolis]